jgi:hypothetical protein
VRRRPAHPDDKYVPSLEGKASHDDAVLEAMGLGDLAPSEVTLSGLVRSLQCAHDNAAILVRRDGTCRVATPEEFLAKFRASARKIAECRRLDASVLGLA